MNAQEKVQASFNMIKEHVMNGRVLVSDEDGLSNMSSAAQP